MNQQELVKLLRTVQRNVACPQCGRRYLFSDIKIRGVVDSICFLELNCPEHMPLIATVFVKGEKRGPEFPEKQKMIESDDVIKVHKFLKGFKGQFEEIFKGKV